MKLDSVIPTAHIKAQKADMAKMVIMPGDPLRAKYIAEKFLTNVKQINSVRNMLMYTGLYKDKTITIAGSGMGMPSIGIYSYELFKFYDVDCIIRVGSAGSYQSDVKVLDIINVSKSYSKSTYAKMMAKHLSSPLASLVKKPIICSSEKINKIIINTAEDLDNKLINAPINLKSGMVHCSDVFYYQFDKQFKELEKMFEDINCKKCLCVEMESFALFTNAILLKKHAACLLTISDSLVNGEKLSAENREKGFDKMINLALESAVNFIESF